MDGAGDGGAVHAIQHRQGLVRELEAQHHQRRQHPVAEGQPRLGPGTSSTTAPMAAALGEGAFVPRRPGVGQLDDKVAEVLPGEPGKARMGQGRTGPCWRSHPGMIVRPAHVCTIPAIDPQLSCTKSLAPNRSA
jgi:hypothetical protein